MAGSLRRLGTRRAGVLAAAGLVVAIAALSACQERTSGASTVPAEGGSTAEAGGAVAAVDPAPEIPIDPRMQAAFIAVYGQAAPFTDPAVKECPPGVREPADLVEMGGGLAALIVTTRVEFIHACSGPVSIHYLRSSDGDFQRVRSWPDLMPGDDHGASAQVRVRSDLFTNPALESRGGGSAQGYTCTTLHLVELTPAGPVQRLEFLSHWDDSGADPPRTPDFDATVEAGERDQSLVLEYTWEGGRIERIPLRRRGAVFEPVPGRRLPDNC